MEGLKSINKSSSLLLLLLLLKETKIAIYKKG